VRLAAAVIARALRLWWSEFFLLTLFNLAWLALQIPIVTGPPATAAMYVIARRLAAGEVLSPRDGWLAFRQMAWPAWRWGLVNLVVIVVILGNFWAYQDFVGWGWTALRLAWGAIAVLWLVANLFYWPFWLAQSDRRLVLALRNSLLLFLKSPGLGLALLLACLALSVVSVLVTVPLAVGLMAWLALVGVLAVDAALGHAPAAPAAANPGVEIELA
jgi:hypothetical protein